MLILGSDIFLGLNRRGWPSSGGLGMSFNVCRGALGSLAILIAIRNASSRARLFVDTHPKASTPRW
jgi:hypothetical protein